MEDKHLHILCFDVPYPVDYGGVFDLYYKIDALNKAGIKIHLHCFSYGRKEAPELNSLCEEVVYYPRESPIVSLASPIPYIVNSRANKQLLKNLLNVNYPILMEGIHCTYFVHSGQLPKDRCFVRLHNVEFQYYRQLAETSTSFAKRIYFKRESALLHKYEMELADMATFWTVTEADLQVFNKQLGYNDVDFLPLFLPKFDAVFDAQMGNFCLYHGNLGVPENEFAANWLLENIFSKLEIPFAIAGKNPSAKLEKAAHQRMHTCLVANPSEHEMQELIKKAQVNILPSFNNTGIKLKLINALYLGKHCIVNSAGVDGSGLNNCCEIVNTTSGMKEAIEKSFNQPFLQSQFENRMAIMNQLFDNQKNAAQMKRWIFEKEPTIPGYSQK